MHRLTLRIAALLALSLFACADDASEASSADAGADAVADAGDAGADADAEDAAADVAPVELVLADGCNPVGAPYDCMLPYPTDFYRGADGQVRVADGALPTAPDGAPLRVDRGFALDGFATHPPILALLPGDIDLSGAVAPYESAAPSLTPTHPSVLLEVGADGTVTPVPHFVERDAQAADLERSALIVRPLVPLGAGLRHIVAVQRLSRADGTPVARGEFMEGLVTGATFADAELGEEAARLRTDVLDPLAAFGVAADDLLLAWDFTVRTDASVMRDLEAVRAGVTAWLADTTPAIAVERVERSDDAVRIRGTLEVPLFVDSELAGAVYVRGDDGLPMQSSVALVPFFAIAAAEVWDGEGELPVALQFGHGFFGDRFEIDQQTHVRTSREVGAVLFAVDNWGLATDDAGVIAGDLVDGPERLMRFVERLGQGYANHWVLSAALRGPMATADAFAGDDGPRYDTSRVAYFGISNGHILGGAQTALNDEIDAVILQSGGASFTFMMSRAAPFAPLMQLVATWLQDPLDRQKFVALASEAMDPIDPITWAPVLRDRGVPVLMQLGVGDSTVPNLAGHLHARALDLPLLQPAPRELPAMRTATVDEVGDSALLEADYGVSSDDWPDRNARPPGRDEGNGVHQDPRNDERLNAQLRAFVRSSEIVHPCGDGPCR